MACAEKLDDFVLNIKNEKIKNYEFDGFKNGKADKHFCTHTKDHLPSTLHTEAGKDFVCLSVYNWVSSNAKRWESLLDFPPPLLFPPNLNMDGPIEEDFPPPKPP